MAEKQKFQDAFAVGTYRVKVYKQPEWENGKKVEGSHKSGDGQYGKWYLYDIKYGDKYYSMFGNEKNKSLLDSGDVALNVWFAKGKKGVEVLHPDDIMAQEQNGGKNDSKPPVTKVSHEDTRVVPLESYDAPNTNDVVRGQICTHLIAAFVSKEGARPISEQEQRVIGDLIDLCMNPPKSQKIDASNLPF